MSEGDISNFPEKFFQNDVLVTEALGWDKSGADIVSKISSGMPEREVFGAIINQYEKGSYIGKLWSTIYNSKKIITYIDVPREHPIAVELGSMIARGGKDIFKGKNFAELLIKYRETNNRFVELQRKREEYMLANLVTQLKKCVADYPSLKSRKKLKVLVQVGATHTKLYMDLKKQGVETTRSFNHMSYTFSIGSVVGRNLVFGSKEISDELVARAIFEAFVRSVLEYNLSRADVSSEKKVIMRGHKMMDDFVVKLASTLSLKDIRNIFDSSISGESHKVEDEKFLDVIYNSYPKIASQLDAWEKQIFK